MTIDGRFILAMTTRETLDTNVDGVANPVIQHDKFNKNEHFNAATTPPGVQIITDTIALVAGAKTLDLTALPKPGGGTYDATGKKLIAWFFGNRAGNTGDIVVVPGAANGYNFNAHATGRVVATKPLSANDSPGWAAGWNGKSTNVQTVAAGDTTIDVSGTGTESFDYVLVFG
jgi:hypothetical protein